MKDSIFQKEYLKIIAEEKHLISEWPDFLDKIPVIGALSKGTTQALVGLGQSGLSVAKRDLKGAVKGIGKTLSSPFQIVGDVLQAPADVAKAAAELLSSGQIKNNQTALKDLDKIAEAVTPQQLKDFKQKNPQIVKDKDDTYVKRLIAFIGINQSIKKPIENAQQNTQQNAKKDDKPNDDKGNIDKKAKAKEYRQKCKKYCKFIWRAARKGNLPVGEYTIQL